MSPPESDDEGGDASRHLAWRATGRVQHEDRRGKERNQVPERVVSRSEKGRILGDGPWSTIRIARHALERDVDGHEEEDVVDPPRWPDCCEELLERAGLEERAVRDDDIDAGIEPTANELHVGNSCPAPELRDVERAALRERHIVQVCNCDCQMGFGQPMAKSLSDRALAGTDRSGKNDQITHRSDRTSRSASVGAGLRAVASGCRAPPRWDRQRRGPTTTR